MCELMQKLADQAKHDNSVEIAERLLYRGTSIDDIAYSTALPRDEVEAIAERLGKKTAQYFSPLTKLTAIHIYGLRLFHFMDISIYDACLNLNPLYIIIFPLQHWATPDFVPSTASATDTILRFRYILQFLMDMIPNPV